MNTIQFEIYADIENNTIRVEPASGSDNEIWMIKDHVVSGMKLLGWEDAEDTAEGVIFHCPDGEDFRKVAGELALTIAVQDRWNATWDGDTRFTKE